MSSLEGTRRGLDVSHLIFLSFFCAGSVLCSRFHLQDTRSALPCPLASRWLFAKRRHPWEKGERWGRWRIHPSSLAGSHGACVFPGASAQLWLPQSQMLLLSVPCFALHRSVIWVWLLTVTVLGGECSTFLSTPCTFWCISQEAYKCNSHFLHFFFPPPL